MHCYLYSILLVVLTTQSTYEYIYTLLYCIICFIFDANSTQKGPGQALNQEPASYEATALTVVPWLCGGAVVSGGVVQRKYNAFTIN